ncbi:MAG: GNAT family N-acetyltransferase [Blastocatellia bacterium]
MSPEEITVREIRTEEVDRLVALEQACGLSTFGRESYLQKAETRASLHLGAFDSREELLGIFTGEIVLDEFHIDNLAVLPDRRRTGIGTALIRIGLREARRRGAVRALLEVRDSNRAARTLYEINGFLPLGTRRDYYREPIEDAQVLALDLTSVFVPVGENLS